MSQPYKTHVRSAAALLLALCAATAQAVPQKIEQFEADSWQRFQSALPRPAAIVFASTDCTHCPAAIAAVAEQLKHRKPQIPLVVVVMDGEQHEDLLRGPHYRQASRLFVFRGQSAALQYTVNPKWRGITPYVALLPKSGPATLITGRPSEQEFGLWLAGAAKP
ncbi:hypothetical protein [Herminiimonas sp. CN]|uniref:hypothetical protein n=1 Tax=Herminiimonas sp. CN TaxID=1349818 RepID=UPI00047398A7|nr:hypothetical protein [Herminiimonas sp. CN]